MKDEKKPKFNPTKYKNDFQRENYDRIVVNVKKGRKDVINDTAKQLGYKSLNEFVVKAIDEKIDREK